ncbi:hypothetical protein [Pseudomonas phage vB_PsaM_M1]|nr:hypothetical protein [Pseudomonas phage vB_PsaM_M1]
MFSKKNLKTGMIVEFKAEDFKGVAFVLLGTENGDIVAGKNNWFPLDAYTDKELFNCQGGHGQSISAIWQPKYNSAFCLEKFDKYDCNLVWKKQPKKTETQLKLEELQKIVEDAQQKIAELKEEVK